MTQRSRTPLIVIDGAIFGTAKRRGQSSGRATQDCPHGGRKPTSVARKLSNIEHFDPNRPEEVVGSAHGSHWERDIWNEVAMRGDSLVNEAVALYRAAMRTQVTLEYDGSPTLSIIESKDVEVTAIRRLYQDHFRNLLMSLYGRRCCVTG